MQTEILGSLDVVLEQFVWIPAFNVRVALGSWVT